LNSLTFFPFFKSLLSSLMAVFSVLWVSWVFGEGAVCGASILGGGAFLEGSRSLMCLPVGPNLV
jgi:hypothetical protein